MKKLCCFFLILLMGVTMFGSASALDPPNQFGAESVDELIDWIKTEEAEESVAWGSWYPFLSAIRKSDSILTVRSTQDEWALESIHVQSDAKYMIYSFCRTGSTDRLSVYTHIPGSQLPLEESVAQLNESYSARYEGLQFANGTATLQGKKIDLYYHDGGVYPLKESGLDVKSLPTAYFDVMGHRVWLIAGSINEKWDNKYLDLIEFEAVSILPFKDVPNTHWAKVYVQKLASFGFVSGYPDGTFKPEKNITRAEFITLVSRILHLSRGNANDGHWASNHMAAAIERSLLQPDEFPIGTWDKPIIRQEMAMIAARAMEFVQDEEKITGTDALTSKISDWSTTSAARKDDIAQAYAKGIFAGYPDGSFRGTKTATRAEAAVVVSRLAYKEYRLT